MKRDIAVLVLIVNMVSTNDTKDISAIMHNMDIVEYVKNKLHYMFVQAKKDDEELIRNTLIFTDKKYKGLKIKLSEVLNS